MKTEVRSESRRMVLRTLYITKEMDDQLRDVAFALRISKNELIRRALGDVLEGAPEVAKEAAAS
jgi:hypothetical protein